SAVIIVENLATGLALPDLPGVVVFMRLGNAVGVLNGIPLLRGVDAVYWGDIDTHGYAILNHARRALPNVKSILMGKETLFAYQNLWGQEPVQNDSAEFSLLQAHERMVYDALCSQAWGKNIRLEQERIPWTCALETINDHFAKQSK